MSELSTYLSNTYSKVIMVCGPAGSGKSTFCKQYPTTYEMDSAFIGDSNFRKQLLKAKSQDFGSYVDMCSMMNWFDWEQAYKEINRLTGMVTGISNLDGFYGNFLLVNVAIAGPGFILGLVDEFIYVSVPPDIRWARIVERDSHKRSLKELMARWLLTEYAESYYYRILFKFHGERIKVVDQDFNFLPTYDLGSFEEQQYVPFAL